MKFADKTTLLLSAFDSHLRSLPSMSRLKADWINDVLLNPAALVEYISPQSLLMLLKDFDLLGTYPQIKEPWSWYKSFSNPDLNRNGEWTSEYWQKAHRFLATNDHHNESNPQINKTLDGLCKRLIEHVVQIREHDFIDRQLLHVIEKISNIARIQQNEFLETVLGEFSDIYFRDTVSPVEVSQMSHFREWFGRETMYLSFTQRSQTGWAKGIEAFQL